MIHLEADNQKAAIFYFSSPAGHVKRALNKIYSAINNEQQQKQNAIIDELKRNTAEFTKKLETKTG